MADSLAAFRAALPDAALAGVEALLLCRLIGLEVGADRARLMELIPQLPALRWVHSCFAGVNHLLFPALVASPVVVTNARGVFSLSLAEWCLHSMLHFAKAGAPLAAAAAARVWDKEVKVVNVRGQSLGIVGYGHIGQVTSGSSLFWGPLHPEP